MRVVKPWPRLPREVGDAPSLETFQARLDGALSTLIQLKMSLLTAGSWARWPLSVPSNTKHSVIPSVPRQEGDQAPAQARTHLCWATAARRPQLLPPTARRHRNPGGKAQCNLFGTASQLGRPQRRELG